MNMNKSGIILEGGGTRGVFTSGVLDCFMENDLYVPYVIGVSAGACNAADYASKQPFRTRKCTIDYLYNDSYLSMKNMILKKELFDMDLIFDKFPNELIPFDYETFFKKDMRCIFVATNCATGEPEYFEEYENKERLMDICKASSSLPYISSMVDIDGTPYLDGGLSDSVPIVKALRDGIKKPIIILTRNHGYRKKVRESIDVSKLIYKDYPKLNEAMYKRNARYNRTMEFIEYLEYNNHAIVIRPELPAIDRKEQNTDILMDFYNHGYEMGEKYLAIIKEFVNVQKKSNI